MSFPTFEHDGIRFHFEDRGAGLPLVWQHGLGGDLQQAFGLYTPAPGIRLLGFDARAHGRTEPLGDVRRISLATTADDLVALLDHRGIERAVVGGLSLGAAVAVITALRHPDRVLGLALLQPAWLDRPLPENARVFVHIAQCLLKWGADAGLTHFRASPEYAAIAAETPALARTLEAQFTDPRAESGVARLERFPNDAPCHDRAELAQIGVPTLILGRRGDPLHPLELAVALAEQIPGAVLQRLTPTAAGAEPTVAEIQAALDAFLADLASRARAGPSADDTQG